MNEFEFMVDCLKKLEYPLILSMNETQIFDIFNAPNRDFFLKWLLMKIDAGFVDFVKNASLEELAELIYVQGFCSNETEAIQLLKSELGNLQEFQILHKMFKSICGKTDNEDASPFFEMEKIEMLLNLDTNLFPLRGNKQVLMDEDRQSKYEEYLQEIEHIEKIMKTKAVKEDDCLFHSLYNGVSIDFQENLSAFTQQCPKILLCQNDLKDTGNNVLAFSKNKQEKLEKCCSDALQLIKYLNNERSVVDFNKKNSVFYQEKTAASTSKSDNMISEISKLYSEVTRLK